MRNTSAAVGPDALDHCDTEGVLRAAQGAQATSNAGDYAGWRFVAPPDTSITEAVVRWFGLGLGSNNWRAPRCLRS